jgi:nitrite reductase (NADH) large subunit
MHILILGNGAAGATTAEEIRKIDTQCAITVVSDEDRYFYSRPRVIELLSGKVTPEQILIRKKEWYEANNIRLMLGTKAVGLNIPEKTVFLSNGESIVYDRLVLALGSNSFVPPFKGAQSPGVFTLRTIDDAEKIIEYSAGRKSAAVIGGGLLGIEAANSLLGRGLSITVIEFFERLLPRQLDTESALILKELLENKGLKFMLGMQTEELAGTEGAVKVKFKNADDFSAGMVVISAGVRPNTGITEGTGIAKNKGIIIDNFGRTNIDDIYACGDVTEHNGIPYCIWPAAREQAAAVARHITGLPGEYKGTVMSTKLKVADLELASIGNINADGGIETVVKKEPGQFKKYFFAGSTLTGAIMIGNTADYGKLQKLIQSGADASELKV